MTAHVTSGRSTKCRSCASREANLKHGMRNTRIYNIWQNMLRRTSTPTNPAYKYYGGRGIEVCDEWKEFMRFYEWSMANGYTNKLTIERIDVDGNYEPSNCCWVDMKTQGKNKRSTLSNRFTKQELLDMVKEYKERNINYKDFAKSKGIAHGTFYKILKGEHYVLGT